MNYLPLRTFILRVFIQSRHVAIIYPDTSRQLGKACTALACLISFVLTAAAQQPASSGRVHLHGRVIDGQNSQPLASATISVRKKVDSMESTHAVCDQLGYFSAEVVPGDYIIQATHTGYSPIWIHLLTDSTLLMHNIGAVKLFNDQLLKEVVVSGQTSNMEIATDKKVFNIESSLSAKGGTAVDALRTIPSVLVSANGRVSLRDGVPVLLLDGKRTSLNLNQIPADQIQSIELITNPSAKYDAQGNRGFINIILKTEKKIGVNGIIRTSYNTQHAHSIGLDGNVRMRKWNVAVSYFDRRRKDISHTTVSRHYQDQRAFLSGMDRKGTEYFQRGKIGLDYYMDKSNMISVDGDVAGGHEDYYNIQKASYVSSIHLLDSTSVRRNPYIEKFTIWHLNANYTHKFRHEEEKLSMYAGLEGYSQPASGTYNTQYFSKDGSSSNRPLLQDYAINYQTKQATFQVDYSKPFRENKARLETGVKVTPHSGTNANSLSGYSQDSLKWVEDKRASYAFAYKDPTYAGYANYSDQQGIFSWIAGVRFEDYTYRGTKPDGTPVVSYRNAGLFPSVFLTWKLPANAKVQLNYSKRVKRPVFSEISPVTDYTDPQNLQQGNSLLRPEYTHLFELSYNQSYKKTSIGGTFYFRTSHNFITTYTYAIAPDTLLTTYINAQGGNTGGVELIVKNSSASWLNLTGSLNVLHTNIQAETLSRDVSNRGFTWFGKITGDLKLLAALTLQLTGNYIAPAIIPQGTTRSSGTLDISAGRAFLKNKVLSVECTLLDVFNTNREKTAIKSRGVFSQTLLNKPQSRILRVSCSYRFRK